VCGWSGLLNFFQWWVVGDEVAGQGCSEKHMTLDAENWVSLWSWNSGPRENKKAEALEKGGQS